MFLTKKNNTRNAVTAPLIYLVALLFLTTGCIAEQDAIFELVELDSDGDGLSDHFEKLNNTNPYKIDTDGDQLSDFDEFNVYMTKASQSDTDEDGLDDGEEVKTYGSNPSLIDTDSDGLDDGYEVARGLDPLSFNEIIDEIEIIDQDSDGLPDAEEIELGTDPLLADSDEDGLSDGAEINTHGTDPLNPDSDGSGLNDGEEVQLGANPADRSDDEDFLPIQILFTLAPNSLISEKSALIQFELNQPHRAHSIKCGLDVSFGDLQECSLTDSKYFENLASGDHKFHVQIIDQLGQISRASIVWSIRPSLAELCASEKVQELKQVIHFPANTRSCEFGANGNLQARNVHVQGMSQQAQKLKMPNDAIICDANLLIKDQKFKSDDFFVLDFNGEALMTNASFLLNQVNDSRPFDFEAVRGMKWKTARSYCAGKNCQVPRHDRLESIKGHMVLDPTKTVENLPLADNEVKLSIIGDNDRNDCHHSGLSLETTIRYITK